MPFVIPRDDGGDVADPPRVRREVVDREQVLAEGGAAVGEPRRVVSGVGDVLEFGCGDIEQHGAGVASLAAFGGRRPLGGELTTTATRFDDDVHPLQGGCFCSSGGPLSLSLERERERERERDDTSLHLQNVHYRVSHRRLFCFV